MKWFLLIMAVLMLADILALAITVTMVTTTVRGLLMTMGM